MNPLIESERLLFAPDSVRARAFTLLHENVAGDARCVLCLLAWLACALGAPGQRVEGLVEEARALVRSQFGQVASLCFEALLDPHCEAARGRLDGLERALGGGALAALPMPAREELN